jgi:hypothetical protein
VGPTISSSGSASKVGQHCIGYEMQPVGVLICKGCRWFLGKENVSPVGVPGRLYGNPYKVLNAWIQMILIIKVCSMFVIKY